MSLDLLPESCQLSWSPRDAGNKLIPFKGRDLLRDSRVVELKRTVYGLAQEWREPARAIDFVCSSRRVPNARVAEARISTFSSISGRIEISKSALKDPGLDAVLLGLHSTGWSVGQTLSDVLIHEWGHLLVNMAIELRYRGHLQDGFEDFTRAVEEQSGIDASVAAFDISGHAQKDNNELFAEAFTDACLHNDDAHPFSIATFEVLTVLWAPKKYWPAWAF